MFADEGVPVFDADAAVHTLQGPDGALVQAIEAEFPGTTGDAGVNRTALAERVLGESAKLQRLEALIHPAVAAEREGFWSATAPRAWWCSTYLCCSKKAGGTRSTGSPSSRLRRKCSGRGCWRGRA
jgi:hypothetical protein